MPAPLSLEVLEAREVPAVGLDPTFAGGGYVVDPFGTAGHLEGAVAVAAGAGGTIWTAGNTPSTAGGQPGDVLVGRLDATGHPDPRFGVQGLATIPLEGPVFVAAVATTPDGGVVVAGTRTATPDIGPVPFPPISDTVVLKLRADGTQDPDFGTGGLTTVSAGPADAVRRVAVGPDGSVVLFGTVSGTWPDPTELALTRLTPAGAPDLKFGTAGTTVVSGPRNWEAGGLVVFPGGAVAVSAADLPVGPTDGDTELSILRFLPDGRPDPAFGTAGRATTDYHSFWFAHATGLAALPDGRLVVSGGSSYGQGLLGWFGPSGGRLADEQFDTGTGMNWVADVVPAPGGGVRTAGYSGSVGAYAVETRPGPGKLADRLVTSPGVGSVAPVILAGPGGTTVVAGVSTPDPFAPAPDGYRLAVARFRDPGTTTSSTTFVEAYATPGGTDPGAMTLYARPVPLLGEAPVTGGTLTFRDGTTILGTADLSALLPGGRASLNLSLTPGDHAVTVEYSGSPGWAASESTARVHVAAPVAPTVDLTVSSPAPAFGEPVELTAAVRDSAGNPLPVGSVTFSDGDRVLGVVPVGTDGTAVLPTTDLRIGVRSVRAAFTGLNAGQAESAAVPLLVSKAYAELALTAAPPAAGRPVTLTVVVTSPSSPGFVPGGTVDVFDGRTRLGSVVLGADGTARFAAALTPGGHTLRAVYRGDRLTFGADSAPVVVSVPADPTPRLVGTTPVHATEDARFTAELATVTLPAGHTYRVWVFWGDGKTGEAVITPVAGRPDRFTLSGSHAYAEPGLYTPYLRVMRDGKMALHIDLTAAVADANWYVGRVAHRTPAGAPDPAVWATIQDTNLLAKAADYTATIDWGHGQTTAGVIRRTAAGRFEVTGTHTFPAPGRDVVRVTVRAAGTGREQTAVSLVTIDAARVPAATR